MTSETVTAPQIVKLMELSLFWNTNSLVKKSLSPAAAEAEKKRAHAKELPETDTIKKQEINGAATVAEDNRYGGRERKASCLEQMCASCCW